MLFELRAVLAQNFPEPCKPSQSQPSGQSQGAEGHPACSSQIEAWLHPRECLSVHTDSDFEVAEMEVASTPRLLFSLPTNSKLYFCIATVAEYTIDF